eukprot:m.30830 g.30830  ORF g.30830 m.30830 type:complete len:307 (-) comp16350_c0_seq1:171-1091(-)
MADSTPTSSTLTMFGCECTQTMLIGAAVAVFALILAKGPLIPLILKLRGSQKKKRRAGVVYLRQFPPGGTVPSYSPACLKLETYLRVAGIEYENIYGMAMSSKGKAPWIQIDDEQVCDSDCCVDYLNKRFDIDLDVHMNATEAATAHLVKRTLEEHTYWGILHNRWVKQLPIVVSEVINLSGFAGVMVGKIASRSVYADLRSHGLARHSDEEIQHRIERDLRAIEAALGDRDFFGGSEPSVTDCVVFGWVSQMIWCPSFESHMEVLIKSELPRLVTHAERMKARAWPDWDSTLRGANKKNTEKKSN